MTFVIGRHCQFHPITVPRGIDGASGGPWAGLPGFLPCMSWGRGDPEPMGCLPTSNAFNSVQRVCGKFEAAQAGSGERDLYRARGKFSRASVVPRTLGAIDVDYSEPARCPRTVRLTISHEEAAVRQDEWFTSYDSARPTGKRCFEIFASHLIVQYRMIFIWTRAACVNQAPSEVHDQYRHAYVM